MTALHRLPGVLTLVLLALSGSAMAQEQCDFAFRVDTQSTAFQALVDGAAERGGFWRPIGQAPDDVQEIGRFVGRLDVCLMTQDGQPRELQVGGRTVTLKSPYVTHCTAALLPGNRLLTNRHCFYDPTLVNAGFGIVREARVNFGYVSKDFTDDVRSFAVGAMEVAQDARTDSMILEIIKGDANTALGGHVPMVMETAPTPRRALTMIHHPRGQPQQFSSGTCQIHPAQADLPEGATNLRHSCESAGGSSGSLLLDARSLAVVGLHNQGGLHAGGGYNGGHRIAAIGAALALDFRDANASVAQADPEDEAQRALIEATLLNADADRRAALERLLAANPGTRAAESARRMLALMAPSAAVTEAEASAALVAALQVASPEARRERLLALSQQYRGAAAAQSAESILLAMDAVGVSASPADDPDPANAAVTPRARGGAGGGATLDDILARGRLACAASDGGTGEPVVDFEGRWLGPGADFCRALAASVLGDPEAVDFLFATPRTAIEMLTSGEADMLVIAPGVQPAGFPNGTVEQVGTLAGDGIAFMIPKVYGVTKATEMDGATLCLLPGSEAETKAAAYFQANNMAYAPVGVSSEQEAASRYFESACDAIVLGSPRLARIRLMADDPDSHAILPERLSGNAYRPFVRRSDPAWRDTVAHVLDSLPDRP